MPTQPEHFEAHLKAISHARWCQLFDLLPELKSADRHGKIVFPESNDPNVVIFPGWIKSTSLSKFFRAFHELNLMVDFDWTSWEEGSLMLNNPGTDFTKLDSLTLFKLLTAAIRADRFSDGFLVAVFTNGIGIGILEELERRFGGQSS